MTRACPDSDIPDGARLVLREEEGWPYAEGDSEREDDHGADDEDWDDEEDEDVWDEDDFERYEREEEAK